MNIQKLFPALLFTIGILSCGEKTEESQPVADTKSAFILKKQPVSNSLQLPVELLPYESAEIHPKVEAYVQRVLVDIGDRVKKGQLLIQLEAPEVNARAAQAGAGFQEVAARFESSRDRYNRIQQAAKEEGAISESELISARNQFMADSSSWLAAKANSQASRQLQTYLAIRSPFDGIITKRKVDVGDFVKSGTPEGILTVENPDKIRVRIHIPEAFISSIPEGDSIQFSTETFPGQSFSAKLSRKSGAIDRTTRTELWEYEFVNRHGTIKSGMYGVADLNLGRSESTFKVPNSAVTTTLEEKFVIRVKNGKVEWIDVREGIQMKDGKEIFGDLQEGDTLLTRSSDEIKEEVSLAVNIENQ